MRLTWKDAIATGLIAAVVIPFVGYLVRGEMPFIQDPRGMAAVGIIGLILSFAAWGLDRGTTFGKVMLIVGVATLGIGVAAAAVGVEGSELLLALFIGAVVMVWGIETLFHSGVLHWGTRHEA